MRNTTNLHWPTEPFGATQRPFAPNRPMLAAVTVGWTGQRQRPAWACAVYLYTDSTRTLTLDGQVVNFGYEVLTTEPDEPATALVERLDEILVACRRHARILAGHNLADDLAALATLGTRRRLPGIDDVRRQWSTRQTRERAMATVIDTAHDLGQPSAAERAEFHGATAPTGTTSVTAAATLHQAIVRTLAVALLAARTAGRVDWTTPVDLDQLVTDAAWDQLALAPPLTCSRAWT
jgi:hypothetical protein